MRIVLSVLAGIVGLAAINFAPMVTLRTPGMEEYSSHGITVYATPKDAAEVPVVAGQIAERANVLRDTIDPANDDPISVIIYPNRQALARKTLGFAGMLLPSWFIGRNTENEVLITSPAAPGPSHDRESIVTASVHEYVHVLTYRVNREPGYWLMEGVALYLAEQVPDTATIRSHADLTWEEYSNPNALQFARVGGYALAYNLVEYLDRTYGWDAVVSLLEKGSSTETVLGVSERELFDTWMSEVRAL
jgi:hypothetical protein